jgi:hypothetical protein
MLEEKHEIYDNLPYNIKLNEGYDINKVKCIEFSITQFSSEKALIFYYLLKIANSTKKKYIKFFKNLCTSW